MDRPRTASRTIAASTSLMRSRSPFLSTSSSAEAVLPVFVGVVPSSARGATLIRGTCHPSS